MPPPFEFGFLVGIFSHRGRVVENRRKSGAIQIKEFVIGKAEPGDEGDLLTESEYDHELLRQLSTPPLLSSLPT
jgi:hypothetical protein